MFRHRLILNFSFLSLSFRFPLQALAIHNAQLVPLNLHQAFGAETGQIARHHFPHRTQSRRQFLMRQRQIEFVGAGLPEASSRSAPGAA